MEDRHVEPARPAAGPLVLPDLLPVRGPRVSVLVASYNYGAYVGECLQSALHQTYEDMEIVVIDNCSTDGSAEIIGNLASKHPRVRFLTNATNVGPYENFRRCFDEASGELALWLSADDRLASPHAVSTLVAAVNTDPSIVLATSRRMFIDGSGAFGLPVPVAEGQFAQSFVMDGIAFGNLVLAHIYNYVSEASTLFRLEMLPRGSGLYAIGGYEALRHTDMVWWLNILARGKGAYVSEILGHHRRHDTQKGQEIGREPGNITELYGMLQGAKTLGYLADARLEVAALARLVTIVSELGESADFDAWEKAGDTATLERISSDAERLRTILGR